MKIFFMIVQSKKCIHKHCELVIFLHSESGFKRVNKIGQFSAQFIKSFIQLNHNYVIVFLINIIKYWHSKMYLHCFVIPKVALDET